MDYENLVTTLKAFIKAEKREIELLRLISTSQAKLAAQIRGEIVQKLQKPLGCDVSDQEI